MTWLSINPNSLSPEVKAACAAILGYSETECDDQPLKPTELADAFNVVDPEVCKLSGSNPHTKLETNYDRI